MDEHRLAGPEHKLERLIFFSDAVFAIAITLLVIEIHAPRLPVATDTDGYLLALLEESPSFAGFIISFFVIGAFWAGHHRAFAFARTWDDRLNGPNLLLLFTMAAMPFFTAFMSGNSTARLPVALYCGWLIVAGLCNIRLQRRVTAPPVVDPTSPATALTSVRRRGWSVVIGATLALLLALVLPYPSTGLIALATIGVWRRLLTRAAVDV